jgi:hypothetical protein
MPKPKGQTLAEVISGLENLNPADNPVPKCGAGSGWMRASLTQIAQCHTFALLPNGEDSRGVALELHVARELGIPVKQIGEF